MLARLLTLWAKVRDSLWFIPGLLTLASSVLAVVLVSFERGGDVAPGLETHWFFGGGAEGARGVLSAIAGGLITVTGVVFSVTIVALQLASSQFTPRVLRSFTADRANQVVLGVFIATFTYTLLVLRTVHSPTGGGEPFVPLLAVTVAVGLVVLSIGCLIFFINHAARSIQISAILDRITRETVRNVHRLFPERVGEPDEEGPLDPGEYEGEAVTVRADAAGYLQAVDARTLFKVGEDARAVVRMEARVGAFVLPGETLALLRFESGAHPGVADRVRRAFVVGTERTPDQDVEFGVIELADIAVKALSPGINDPTTALHCIDRLGEVLLALATRNPPRDLRTKEGRVHFVARHTTLVEVLGLAFDQIRHFGADDAAVMRRLLDVLSRLEALAPDGRRPPIAAARERVEAAWERFAHPDENATALPGADKA